MSLVWFPAAPWKVFGSFKIVLNVELKGMITTKYSCLIILMFTKDGWNRKISWFWMIFACGT